MDGETSVRVLIADPHALVREGLRAILCRQPDMQIVGEASSAQETREHFRRLRPHVLVTELDFPDGSGRGLIAALHQEVPSSGILVLTLQQGEESIYTALQAGAKGYLFKDTSVEAIPAAIRMLYGGQKALDTHVTAKLVGRLQRLPLTPREHEVLEQIAAGKSNLEIGHALFITEGTVKSHINNILAKLGVCDRTQAALIALERGLVSRH